MAHEYPKTIKEQHAESETSKNLKSAHCIRPSLAPFRVGAGSYSAVPLAEQIPSRNVGDEGRDRYTLSHILSHMQVLHVTTSLILRFVFIAQWPLCHVQSLRHDE